MPGWVKDFQRWKGQKTALRVGEFESAMKRVFGSRVREVSGTSHRWIIDVSELRGDPEFSRGIITIPVAGGQVVKAGYVKICFRAAELLELFPPKEDTDDEND